MKKLPQFVAPALKWWALRSPREQTVLATGALALALILLAVVWLSLSNERTRLRAERPLAEARFRHVQQQTAEAQRLREQIAAPVLEGKALADALAASLQARGLDLKLSALDAGRVRVQGVTDFDEMISWLGTVQRDYRVRVVSLSATREPPAGKIDAVLAVSR